MSHSFSLLHFPNWTASLQHFGGNQSRTWPTVADFLHQKIQLSIQAIWILIFYKFLDHFLRALVPHEQNDYFLLRVFVQHRPFPTFCEEHLLYHEEHFLYHVLQFWMNVEHFLYHDLHFWIHATLIYGVSLNLTSVLMTIGTLLFSWNGLLVRVLFLDSCVLNF